MRIKIKLKELDSIDIKDNCNMSKTFVSKEIFLGDNEDHDKKEKNYSTSMICGGKSSNGKTLFENKDAHMFFSSNDKAIIKKIISNIMGKYDFDIIDYNFKSGDNFFLAQKVAYKKSGQKSYGSIKNNIDSFEDYVKRKYGISSFEVINVNREIDIKYKKDSAIFTSDIFFKINTENKEEIEKLFDCGLGGLTAQGFGFVNKI